jgi:hypothetical protein
MKKPNASHEKVIIKPRPPQDEAQESPIISSPADTTAVPEVNPAEEPAEAEEE